MRFRATRDVRHRGGHQDECGPVFSFDSDVAVVRVTAKGGTEGANVYDYDPPTYGDGYLHSPLTEWEVRGPEPTSTSASPRLRKPRARSSCTKFQDDGPTVGTWDPGEIMLDGWEFVLTERYGHRGRQGRDRRERGVGLR